mgnify:CR=1 FL=1
MNGKKGKQFSSEKCQLNKDSHQINLTDNDDLRLAVNIQAEVQIRKEMD